MMDTAPIWIWLQEAFGAGSRTPMRIEEEFPGGVAGFSQAGPSVWRTVPYITRPQLEGLTSFSLLDAEERFRQALANDWQVLTPDCGRYPFLLKNIANPPAVLYVKGQWPDFSSTPAVAIVGARRTQPFTQKFARMAAYQLTARGVTIVSGNAVGIDHCALAEVLRIKGRAVSILPVDLNSPYLAENAGLRRDIVKQGGALVSEYFCKSSPARQDFHFRNRLITGMCLGVVVIQAKNRSGSMIYATCAADQGRDVFVYPGPPHHPDFAGSRQLLEEGAVPIRNGLDVLRYYANNQ